MKRFVIASGLAALALVVPAVPASADDAACGDLHESVTLQHDLACDIRVMDSGIVIDLNGFSVDGRIEVGEWWWIGYSDITIRNGAAKHIDVLFSGPVHLERLETSFSLRAAEVTMTDVVASGGSGVSDVTFRDGVLSRLTGDGSYGCGTWDIADSTVDRLTTGFECDMTITDSEVREIDSHASDDGSLRLESSTVTGPVSVGGQLAATIVDNHFTGPDAGLTAEDLYLPRSAPMEVRGNRFEGGGGVSISIEDAALTFEGNVVRGADGDGLSIEDYTYDRAEPLGTVRNNWFLGNGGSGLRIGHWQEGLTFVVADNRAVGNAGHGIDAPGDVDGGGNIAADNGLTPECIGVTCSTK